MIQCECLGHICIMVRRPPAIQAVGFFFSRVVRECALHSHTSERYTRVYLFIPSSDSVLLQTVSFRIAWSRARATVDIPFLPQHA